MASLHPRRFLPGYRLISAVLSLAACSTEDTSSRQDSLQIDASEWEEASPVEAGRALEAGRRPVHGEAGWRRAPEQECRARERAISSWLQEFRGCDSDQQCRLEYEENGCVAEFLCGFAVRSDIDRTNFDLEVDRRKAEYVSDCGCAIADCGQVDEAYCDPATKLCKGRLRRTSEP